MIIEKVTAKYSIASYFIMDDNDDDDIDDIIEIAYLLRFEIMLEN